MSETHYTTVDAFVARGCSSTPRTTLPFSSSSSSSSTSMTALQAEAKKTKKADIPAIRKKEFVSLMAEELGYTKLDAELALTTALDLIAENLTAGNKVVLPGFGTFEPRTRSARKGRNPKTGAEIDIQASIGAGFSPAKALKDKLNGRDDKLRNDEEK